MTLDNKISFISGAAVSTVTAVNQYQGVTFDSILSMAILGAVGGFFGLAGKQLFYFLKKKYESRS
jgi:H+/Cl- antiporter ClcA